MPWILIIEDQKSEKSVRSSCKRLIEVQFVVYVYVTTAPLGILLDAWCLPLNQPLPGGWSAAEWSEWHSSPEGLFVIDSAGPWTIDLPWVKRAVYVSVCADTEEAWQTCPLSADGGMHNSIWRQFHAVSLPVSSLFPETDKAGLGCTGEAGDTLVLPYLLSRGLPPPSYMS